MQGVKEAIDRMVSDGWTLTIASNQGGCDWHEVKARSLTQGQRFQIPDCPESENFFSGDTFVVRSIETHRDAIEVGTDSQDFVLVKNETVLVQYKTIEEAIEECQFAADLCGIEDAVLCPAMDGRSAVSMIKAAHTWRTKPIDIDDYNMGSFRKPEPGMINLFERMFSAVMPDDDRIMIGDRPEDKGAADAAGFRFLDAAEWRSGASVQVRS